MTTTVAKGIGATGTAWTASAASIWASAKAASLSSLATVSPAQEQAAWLVSFLAAIVGLMAGIGGLGVIYWTCKSLAAKARESNAAARESNAAAEKSEVERIQLQLHEGHERAMRRRDLEMDGEALP